jgi:hypothetical protein
MPSLKPIPMRDRLPDEVKAYIVCGLAAYSSPSTVARAVKQEFGVDVSRQQVESYDPTKQAGRHLSERWRVLFERTRTAFRSDIDAVPIAHQAVRLQMLWRMAQRAEEMGNLMGAAALLEQAAKEVGGCFGGGLPQYVAAEPREIGRDRLEHLSQRFGRALTVVPSGQQTGQQGS